MPIQRFSRKAPQILIRRDQRPRYRNAVFMFFKWIAKLQWNPRALSVAGGQKKIDLIERRKAPDGQDPIAVSPGTSQFSNRIDVNSILDDPSIKTV